ncbi:hypothetical protein KID03_09650 [bacterium]|uniref:Uncharacterized protein n=1 Tax=Candidatus Scatenecus faecavium TaxID=2840915 RepID=A0A9D1FWX8_9BACT|nr:hypothetical protein [bacterium]HIS83224.1 hypothetical protein [Candidatus Scatenecus faecavium]
MSQAEFTDEYAFVEEAHTRLLEINNFVKILKAVVFQDDDVYYLQDFVELILQKQYELSDFLEEALAKPIFPVLKQK